MGEGILIYGLHGNKRRYTKDLQGFADKILAGGKVRKSVYIFGKTNKPNWVSSKKRKMFW